VPRLSRVVAASLVHCCKILVDHAGLLPQDIEVASLLAAKVTVRHHEQWTAGSQSGKF